MNKKVDYMLLWNVLWRFTGVNMIVLILGIALSFKNAQAIYLIMPNIVIPAVFGSNCLKRAKGKNVHITPAMMYIIATSITISIMMVIYSKYTISFMLMFVSSMIWTLKFASPTLDVVEKKDE